MSKTPKKKVTTGKLSKEQASLAADEKWLLDFIHQDVPRRAERLNEIVMLVTLVMEAMSPPSGPTNWPNGPEADWQRRVFDEAIASFHRFSCLWHNLMSYKSGIDWIGFQEVRRIGNLVDLLEHKLGPFQRLATNSFAEHVAIDVEDNISLATGHYISRPWLADTQEVRP